MAVEFKTFEASASTITIGGTITAGTDNIISGPFPRYTISKELIIKDTLFIGEKYSITVTGTALITGSGISMLTPGARQNKLHEVMKDMLRIRGQRGTLIIEPYDGGTNTEKIRFDDAALLSVELPEQSDTSQGTQSQEYTFTFEATILNPDGETIAGPDASNLKDVTETWQFNLLEGETTQKEVEDLTGSITDQVYRNFSVTHSLTATGNPVVNKTTPGDMQSGYVAAKNYVTGRLTTLTNNPFSDMVKDFGKGGDQQRVFLTGAGEPAPNPPTDYIAYNQVNSYIQDILEGTYSVERTWVASRYAATCTVEVVDGKDQTAEFNTVEVSVSIQGHETAGPDATTSKKYQNAYSFYDANFDTSALLSAFAAKFYTGGYTLKTVPRSLSTTHSQTAGTINIAATFDDADVDVAGAISSSVTCTDNNPDGGNETVAILAVIARAGGPIIQDMATTGERTKSLAVEAQMPRGASKPTFGWSNYAPANGYRQNFTESYSESTGRYSLTVDWVYTGQDYGR